MDKVYVLLYKPYVYADFECGGEEEYKTILTSENPGIEGIFSTKERADKELSNILKSNYDREDRKHYREYHYIIQEHIINNTDQKLVKVLA